MDEFDVLICGEAVAAEESQRAAHAHFCAQLLPELAREHGLAFGAELGYYRRFSLLLARHAMRETAQRQAEHCALRAARLLAQPPLALAEVEEVRTEFRRLLLCSGIAHQSNQAAELF